MRYLFLYLCLPVLFSHSLEAQNCKKCLTIASYNVENLFDTEDDPLTDDAEFLPHTKKDWNTEKYNQKQKNLARAIAHIGGKGPDLIGLVEVENKKVLEDLIKQPDLVARNYSIVHYDSPDARGIDVALLYDSKKFRAISSDKLPVIDSQNPNFKTRDILYAQFLYKKDTLNIFVNHWPSRRSGEEGVARRGLAAEVAREKVDKLLAKNPQAKIILMGDFNDTPTDENITQGLGVVGKREDMTPKTLWSPLTPLAIQKKGTHYFKGEWNMLDQLIVSKGLVADKGLRYDSVHIFDADFLQETEPKYKGQPLRTFVGNKYLGGYSDHFPIYLFLRKK